MKTPVITTLNIPLIAAAASHFKCTGKLKQSQNNLVYLDIDDAYILELFPLLQDQTIKMPDYFGKGSAGAHITVVYPEENKKINKEELGVEHAFSINALAAAEIGHKTYYVLLVEAPSLLQLRRQYQLPDLLCFKGYAVGFHITIGVKE
jgi:hypothetical protein